MKANYWAGPWILVCSLNHWVEITLLFWKLELTFPVIHEQLLICTPFTSVPYVPCRGICRMWRAYGHCDCPGRLQQHLSLGSDECVPPETHTCARHWAPKHPGDSKFQLQAAVKWGSSFPNEPYVTLFAVSFVFTSGQRHSVWSRYQIWIQTEWL